MRRIHPTRATALIVPAALAFTLAACGDDSEPAADEPIDTVVDTTVPPTTPATTASPTAPPTTVADGYEHPTGADEVVVSIAYEGGFMTMEATFAQLPSLLVTGDAREFSLGPQIEIYPGPLLPNVQLADIGEAGIQELLALADEHGLLQDREYDADTNVADASDTVVTISANGETYVHRAYALGLGGGPGMTEETGDRAELQAFVDAAMMTLGTSETEAFEAETYLVRSFPIDDVSGYEIEPTIVEWSVDGVDLAAASDCVEIPADQVADLFVDANQLTFFEQDGTTYQLAVKPQLPGDSC
ncbi:hypothetical protein BDK89_2594 [Ilumatobacter fluminis]|uniref:LppX_LprAFG lipoprotein n=1 Tax=Ilumatobacter fluminis TaxID=467091 RepID=A0A4R7I362_9ACTN|nr:hypothetical protein [Ilumatobacter fluminis]TDT16993.1 hypothetical protein BDK89_2594 [Ilumatobacter fluminis]